MDYKDISRTVEPFIYKKVISKKSDNIIFELTELKKEKIVLEITEPYEGINNAYFTIIQNKNKYYLYYRGLAHPSFKNPEKTKYYEHNELLPYECFCLAESDDGLNFIKKNYNIVRNKYIREEVNGVLKWDNYCHNFFPYYSKKEDKFYGIAGVSLINGGLHLHDSHDGIHWNRLGCIISENLILSNWCHINHFDTHNCIVYNKKQSMYYLFLRHNDKRNRWIQYTKTADFKNFVKCKEISINNLPRQNIYTPSIFEYPNSNYFIGIPTLGNERIKHCNVLITSNNCDEWDVLSDNIFDKQEKMGVCGIVLSEDKNKMFMYVNNNDLYSVNNVECYSFPTDRLNKIICREDDGWIITNEIDIFNDMIWVNFEVLNSNGFITVELILNNKCIKRSKKYTGNEKYLLVEWDNCENCDNLDVFNVVNKKSLNKVINYNIKFNLSKCCLYSFYYNDRNY